MKTIKHKLIASRNAIMAAVFDTTAGWKLTADGKGIELKDGNPVYVDSSGTEATIDRETIARLNGEAKSHRERAEAAEAKLKAFEKITDPAKALEAIETMKKLDQKKLIDAGEVDKVKAEITAQFQTQLTEAQKANGDLQANLNNMKIGNIFANSEFVRDSIATPRDMFQDSFAKFFKVNDKGEIEALDRAGNRLMSKAKIGDYASPEEALQLLVESHPQKDTILKPALKPGTGGNGNGGARGGGNVMKRAQYDALPPAEQGQVALRMNKGEISIVD